MRSMCGADAGCLAINYQSLFLQPDRRKPSSCQRDREGDIERDRERERERDRERDRERERGRERGGERETGRAKER